MYYEINVSNKGTHFFATAKRSLLTEEEAQIMLRLFLNRFPTSEGYNITISRVIQSSAQYSVEEFLQKEIDDLQLKAKNAVYSQERARLTDLMGTRQRQLKDYVEACDV